MINAIALDDEPMALEVIKSHASKISFIHLKATFDDPTEALQYLQTNDIDLVFLDINMPDITGMDFSQLLPSTTAFIFTTAYSQYAVDAFKINALDYLMKPIGFQRFVQACQKAHQSIKKEEAQVDYVFVKDGYDWIRISVADLLYVGSEGNYMVFKEKTRQTLSRMTLTEAQELLPKQQFFRVHKSYLVNLTHIQKIERHQVSVSNNDFVPVAANYRDELMEALKKKWKVN
jgi:two-component system, LytTR family, response regulator